MQAAALAAGLVPGWLDAEVPEPAAVALCELGTTAMDVTYASLAAWSRAATVQLRAGGVSPNDFVGLAVAEGATLLVQQLACWRCGAAFVPLDTAALPATRPLLHDPQPLWWLPRLHSAALHRRMLLRSPPSARMPLQRRIVRRARRVQPFALRLRSDPAWRTPPGARLLGGDAHEDRCAATPG